MTYELAKELKAAGFSQHGNGVLKPSRLLFDIKTGQKAGNSEAMYFPTLSELIEACETFESLNLNVDGTWQALAPWLPEDGKEVGEGLGATPEEAVARLWLVLNSQTSPEDEV